MLVQIFHLAPYKVKSDIRLLRYWGLKYNNIKKTVKYFLVPIFTTRGASNPNNFGMVEFGLSRSFFWHLAKSDWTYSSWDINCQENSGAGAAGAVAAVGVHYVSKVLIWGNFRWNGGPKAWKLPVVLGHQTIICADQYQYTMSGSWGFLALRGDQQNPMRLTTFFISIQLECYWWAKVGFC